MGYLVETPHAYPELTVRENLEVFRRLRGLRDANAVERTIERLALTPYADRRAGTLSLGNAQRLGLAKALLHDPALLLLDEPANGLDPAGVVEIRELLRELAHERGVTIFLSSHLLGEVARIATRFGVIHQGRLLEELSAAEMERQRARWLLVDARDREGARATLTAAGLVVDELRAEMMNASEWDGWRAPPLRRTRDCASGGGRAAAGRAGDRSHAAECRRRRPGVAVPAAGRRDAGRR